MRKLLAAAAAITLALTMAACEPEGGGSPNPSEGNRPRRNPQVAAPPPEPKKKDGDQGAQPAPVQGDPSAHNTQPGSVNLFVDWKSENYTTPSCKWKKNGTEFPCANMGKPTREPGEQLIDGSWEHGTDGKSGDTFEIIAYGTRAVHQITCEMSFKGQWFEGQMIDGPFTCHLLATLP